MDYKSSSRNWRWSVLISIHILLLSFAGQVVQSSEFNHEYPPPPHLDIHQTQQQQQKNSAGAADGSSFPNLEKPLVIPVEHHATDPKVEVLSGNGELAPENVQGNPSDSQVHSDPPKIEEIVQESGSDSSFAENETETEQRMADLTMDLEKLLKMPSDTHIHSHSNPPQQEKSESDSVEVVEPVTSPPLAENVLTNQAQEQDSPSVHETPESLVGSLPETPNNEPPQEDAHHDDHDHSHEDSSSSAEEETSSTTVHENEPTSEDQAEESNPVTETHVGNLPEAHTHEHEHDHGHEVNSSVEEETPSSSVPEKESTAEDLVQESSSVPETPEGVLGIVPEPETHTHEHPQEHAHHDDHDHNHSHEVNSTSADEWTPSSTVPEKESTEHLDEESASVPETPESVIGIVPEPETHTHEPEEHPHDHSHEVSSTSADEGTPSSTVPEEESRAEDLVQESSSVPETPESVLGIVPEPETHTHEHPQEHAHHDDHDHDHSHEVSSTSVEEETPSSTIPEEEPTTEHRVEESTSVPETPESVFGIASEPETHTHEHHHHHHDRSHEVSSSSVEDETPSEQIPIPKEKESSPFVAVVKHLSYTLLFFLPEHLQDTILDVNDALILTGIIALTLVSICVPYYFIDQIFAVRPLKKKVVELNRNLWKVSTAYENQQEDFEAYKERALAYDDDKEKIEKLETELHLVKQLDSKHQERIKRLEKELRVSAKTANEVEDLVQITLNEKKAVIEELEKMKSHLLSVQAKYKSASDALESSKAETLNLTMNVDVLTHSNNISELKLKSLEKDITDYKALLLTEGEKRKEYEKDIERYEKDKEGVQKEMKDLKAILHQYEETVNNLSQEISLKENELMGLKETLGEDSPLVEAAELSAKLKASQENAIALQIRVDSLTLEHGSLSQKLELMTSSAKVLGEEKDQAENKLRVLESYFKEKEEELRTMVEKYESEKLTRGMDKEELIILIEEKEDEIRELKRRIETMKQEHEETKLAHRNEIRTQEAKGHENWLLLCQSERKLQEARKESETLRQMLTTLSREKDQTDGFEELDGEMKMNYYPVGLTSDMIPPPLPLDDNTPTYIGLEFGLGNLIPPLPLDDEDLDSPLRDREPMRPPPLGRLSPTFSDNENDPLSPIGRGGGYDYSSGSSSPHRRPPSRESWINGNDRGSENLNNNGHSNETRGGGKRRGRGQHQQMPRTSSPINHGVNV